RAKGLLTGKLFEYMASGRPILCIGPEDGDAARILRETGAGQTISFEGKEKMKEALKNLYQRYLNHTLPNNTNTAVEQFSRKNMSEKYAMLLNHSI
ncbi:MAG: glycosyl transferase family 1, partial [Bacteroidales bacterium]|nr:glycosyl transferase family 1 [Bacteroidales bacterium]